MASTLRGWARSASAATKMITVEQIIGYNFKSPDLLREALDQSSRTQPTSGGRLKSRTYNTRLALVGDAEALAYLAHQWYNKSNLTGVQWESIRINTLSNNNFGNVGFSLGLDECTIPNACQDKYDMASTIEAIVGAVYKDGADPAEVETVMSRLKITHRLLDRPDRAWLYSAMQTKRDLPSQYFVGRQFELQELFFKINPKALPRFDKDGRVARLPLHEARMQEAEEAQRKKQEEERKKQEEERKKKEEERKKQAEKEAALRRERWKLIEERTRAKIELKKQMRMAAQLAELSLWGRVCRLWLGPDYQAPPAADKVRSHGQAKPIKKVAGEAKTPVTPSVSFWKRLKTLWYGPTQEAVTSNTISANGPPLSGPKTKPSTASESASKAEVDRPATSASTSSQTVAQKAEDTTTTTSEASSQDDDHSPVTEVREEFSDESDFEVDDSPDKDLEPDTMEGVQDLVAQIIGQKADQEKTIHLLKSQGESKHSATFLKARQKMTSIERRLVASKKLLKRMKKYEFPKKPK